MTRATETCMYGWVWHKEKNIIVLSVQYLKQHVGIEFTLLASNNKLQ